MSGSKPRHGSHVKNKKNLVKKNLNILSSFKDITESNCSKPQITFIQKPENSGANTARTVIKKSSFVKATKTSCDKKHSKAKKIKRSEFKKSLATGKQLNLNLKLDKLLGGYTSRATGTSLGSNKSASRNSSKNKHKSLKKFCLTSRECTSPGKSIPKKRIKIAKSKKGKKGNQTDRSHHNLASQLALHMATSKIKLNTKENQPRKST